MRISPEDPEKAKIRSQLRNKPKSTADCAMLKRRFTQESKQGNVDIAYAALTTLPKEKRNEVNTFYFFSHLIEKGRDDIIADISEHGTTEEKESLQHQIMKFDTYISNISHKKSSAKAPKQEQKHVEKNINRFSQLKEGLGTLLGRSKPIAPEMKVRVDSPDSASTTSDSYNDSDKHEPPKPF